MTQSVKLLDVVALIADLPDKDLLRGQVGTVVESLGPAFSRSNSLTTKETLRELALRDSQLLVLHYQPQQAA